MDRRILAISFLVLLVITSSVAVPGTFAQKASTAEQDEINGPGGLMSLIGISNHTTNSSPTNPLQIKVHHPAHVRKFIGPSVLLSGGNAPASVWTAYGFNGLSCTHTTTTDWTDPSLCGHGQTIAIVDAFDDPNIANDLQTFDTQFGLPACTTANSCFVKSSPSGIKTDSGWALEISLDVEWAHSIAPGAKIVLVESLDNSIANLLGGESTAVGAGAQQVSNSWGSSEFSTESTYDSYFNSTTASFFASSGDAGHGVEWPAASPYVIAVGGTTLNVNSSGNYLNETAWSGSGGGLSTYVSKPSYQNNFLAGNQRGVPDVAYDGDPNTGVYVYDSVPINGQSGWWTVGGTSAGSPQWAAISAIANSQGANLASASFGASVALYNAATGAQSHPQTNPYLANYHDITIGNNGACGSLCNTIMGYDEVTGLGSPQVNNLIPYLLTLTTPTAPSAPQNLVAKGGNGQISLTWNSPASNGGSTITGYNIYRGTTPGGEGTTAIATVGGSTTLYTDSGLTNGKTYYYTVTAVNSVGQSPTSNESSATPQQITKISTKTSLASNVNPSVSGQRVAFSARVTPVPPATGTPTGTVTFTIDGTAQPPVTMSSGRANLSPITALSVGTHTITAQYSGDSNFNTSTSSALTQTVNKASSSTTVSSNVNPSVSGQKVTFTARVTPVSPATGTPTGTVTFSIDGTPQSPITLTSGRANLSTTMLSVGTHTITAQYSGNSNFNTSTSSALTQTVH